MEFFKNILLIPGLLVLSLLSAQAGGESHSKHHDHHSAHRNNEDESPSTMIMDKTTFIVGGVDGVTSMGTTKDETTFNYDIKLMGMTSFTGKDMLMTAIRSGNFAIMDPFGMSGEARLDTGFKSSDNLELQKAFYKFPVGDDF